jgi:hypothetical protein
MKSYKIFFWILDDLFTESDFSVWINARFAQNLFDSDELVVFSHTIASRSGAGFDLSTIQGYS